MDVSGPSPALSDVGPGHHALLYAWIARGASLRAGEARALPTLRRAIWRYGLQRGRRMALRAQADGRPLDVMTYLAYGEWEARPGETSAQYVETGPDLQQRVLRCPWNNAWREHDVLRYGATYCLDIDRALLHGFSPALRLDVAGTLSRGQRQCDFCFRGAGLSVVDLDALAALRREVRERAVRPWRYHLGHLYATLADMLPAGLGPLGEEAVEAGLAVYAQTYGQPAVEAIVALRGVDFWASDGPTATTT